MGFRYEAKEFADKLNVRGYARNMHDGSVELEVEGEEKDLKTFAAWYASNKNLATVEHSDVHESDIQGYREFQIY